MKVYILIIIAVLCSYLAFADSESAGATLNITAVNTVPTIVGTARLPTEADITEDIKFYIQATDAENDTMTAYCQLYNGSIAYGSPITHSLPDNFAENVCNVSASLTAPNELWHADIWVIDDQNGTSINSTTLSVSVGAFLSNLQNITHYNLTIQITFDTAIATNASIEYSLDNNVSNMNYTIYFSTQELSHNYTIPIHENNTLYFNITTYTNISGAIEEWGPYDISYDCEPNFICTDWSACVDGWKTRTCYDNNTCGKSNLPETNTSCVIGGGGGGGVSREEEVEPETFLETPLIPGEPATCGNGQIDIGETFLNCNKDIPPTMFDYFKCIGAGKDRCVYYDSYATIGIVMVTVSIASIFLFSKFNMGFIAATRKRRTVAGIIRKYQRKR